MHKSIRAHNHYSIRQYLAPEIICRHAVLREKNDISLVKTKVSILFKEGYGWSLCGVTGHNIP